MSDTNDPFAATPYVPPAQRDASNDAPAPPEESVETPAGLDAPAESPDVPTEPTEPEPVEEGPVETDEASAPVESDIPEAHTPEAPAADAPTEVFAHRYPTAKTFAEDASAASGTPTQQLPPFAVPTESALEQPKPKKRRGRKVLVGATVLLLGAAGGIGGAAGYDALIDDNESTVVNSLNSKDTGGRAPTGAVEKVAQSVLPSVVQINVKGSSEASSGTGIIISSDGQIITNNHVVESAASGGTITVSFNDGTISRATIVGRDPVTDLAVIKAKDKSGLTPATLGNSSELKVGQEVVAIGSPFGLESTVTSGIISALNRPVSPGDSQGSNKSSVFPAVQTDAAINPGNSGGPLVDLDGRVVAINSAIRTNGSTEGSIGLGFAIPIDLAKNVAQQLAKGETVRHALINITVGNSIDSDGITTVGAEVKEITAGGAGAKAGLKKGDVITALNGHAVAGADSLVASIRGFQPGEKVTLTLLRNGKVQKVGVTLDSDDGKLGS